jgi:hypothetical protein
MHKKRWWLLLCFTGSFSWMCLHPLKVGAQDTSSGVQTSDSTTSSTSNDSLVMPQDSNQIASPDNATAEPSPFKTIDSQPVLSIQPKRLPDGDVSDLRRQDDFWYVAAGPDKKPSPPKDDQNWWTRFTGWLEKAWGQTWFPFLVWSILAGAFVAVIVVVLQSGSGESWFRRSRNLSKLTLDEKDTPKAGLPEWHKAMESAVNAGQYASAVRYLFLMTLQEMGDRALISLLDESSNREYVRALDGHPLQIEFARLVRYYDYSFYGGFAPDRSGFEKIRGEFEQFQHKLGTI